MPLPRYLARSTPSPPLLASARCLANPPSISLFASSRRLCSVRLLASPPSISLAASAHLSSSSAVGVPVVLRRPCPWRAPLPLSLESTAASSPGEHRLLHFGQV
ncbi:hypothetical protein Sjap_008418 [Stephania japonica]|uniref:Uncharacterized protein n=1 Tax=Stephania japonica TaxID=461633 RepID=A0AAP0JQ47_9MAGN